MKATERTTNLANLAIASQAIVRVLDGMGGYAPDDVEGIVYDAKAFFEHFAEAIDPESSPEQRAISKQMMSEFAGDLFDLCWEFAIAE